MATCSCSCTVKHRDLIRPSPDRVRVRCQWNKVCAFAQDSSAANYINLARSKLLSYKWRYGHREKRGKGDRQGCISRVICSGPDSAAPAVVDCVTFDKPIESLRTMERETACDRRLPRS